MLSIPYVPEVLFGIFSFVSYLNMTKGHLCSMITFCVEEIRNRFFQHDILK
jgi:hypothetical protein